jgi:uncharacterized protein YlzI (FlbEa/FlbD family)
MVKLTTLKGAPYYVNLDLAESMFRMPDTEETRIQFNSAREQSVKETPEQILKLKKS